MTVTTEGSPRPDTSDMTRMHMVFRDALDAAPTLIGTVPGGETARSAHVGAYYANVLALLKGHHAGEDELVTPLLVERCDAEDAALAARIGAQHSLVHDPVLVAEVSVARWAGSADPGFRDEVLVELDLLGSALVPHLDEEEAEVLPLAQKYLTVDEWGQLPSHGMQSFTGDNLWLVIGLIREKMSDAQLEHMDGAMPPPVSEAWRAVGQAEFQTFVSELRT
jgi:Hemerythrin HHE cation binding domain